MARDTDVRKAAGRASAAGPADPAAPVLVETPASAEADSALVPDERPAAVDPAPIPEAAAAEVAAGGAAAPVSADAQQPGLGGELRMPDLEVTAMAPSRRRAGRRFGASPTIIPGAEVTEEMWRELDADPLLKLRPVAPYSP